MKFPHREKDGSPSRVMKRHAIPAIRPASLVDSSRSPDDPMLVADDVDTWATFDQVVELLRWYGETEDGVRVAYVERVA